MDNLNNIRLQKEKKTVKFMFRYSPAASQPASVIQVTIISSVADFLESPAINRRDIGLSTTPLPLSIQHGNGNDGMF